MSTPRVLLFGSSGSGKSSLLGALAQAAPVFEAELIDESGGLERLQQRTYSKKIAATENLESYDLKVRPTDPKSAPAVSRVTVLDCSGDDALKMLQSPAPFADAHPLNKPVLDADAVVLVIDASLQGKQLNAEFKQCAHWLRELHAFRGRRCGIAELPVYFVLAKCDLLARKEDTAGAWIKRIEETKTRFDESFRKFLKDHAPGFGSINLRLSATAIQRPAFTDKAAKSHEPFGVAELFRECLQSARDFQERRTVAQGKMQNVLAGLMGLIVLLGLSVVFLSEFQPPPRGTTLDEQAMEALPKPEATPAERMAGSPKRLESKLKSLEEIEKQATAGTYLSDGAKESVVKYRTELAEYVQLTQQAQDVLKLPHEASNDEQMQQLRAKAKAFNLPAERKADWAETRLGRQIGRVHKEYDALDAALKDEDEWLLGQIDENRTLLKAGNRYYGKLLDQDKGATQDAQKWFKNYRTQWKAEVPTVGKDKLPGVTRMFYEDLQKFEPVRKSRLEWNISKDELKTIADLIQKKLKSG